MFVYKCICTEAYFQNKDASNVLEVALRTN